MTAAPAWRGNAFGTLPTNIDPTSNQTGTPVATGDWMLLALMYQAGTSLRTVTVDPAWTMIRDQLQVGAGTMAIGIYAKKRLAGESNYTFTQLGSGNQAQYCLTWFSGCDDIANWVIGAFGDRASSGGTTLVNIPSVTSSVANSAVCAWGFERTTADEAYTQFSMDNGMTIVGAVERAAAEVFPILGYKVLPAPAASGVTVFTSPNTHAYNGLGFHFVIPPPPGPVGLTVKRWSGSALVDAKAYLKTNTGVAAPGRVLRMDRGYPSAANFVAATTEKQSAHRGGSADFQEYSLHAYTQSVLRGFGALEISLARTSDGVWFGLHDNSLLRTSGVDVVPSTLTWAQVQTYQINLAGLSSAQAPRPYMRLEQLLDTYGSTHVILVDPKYSISQGASLVALMNTYPAAVRSRLIAKYFCTGTSWATTARASGYLTWGYYYQTDVASLPSNQGYWDLLGMDYAADQASWDAVKSYGKKVMAHTIQTTAHATTARSKGADALQVAGVKALKGF